MAKVSVDLNKLIASYGGSATIVELVQELTLAREVVAATEVLLAKPEVKMAALAAPRLSTDIIRLKEALKAYNK